MRKWILAATLSAAMLGSTLLTMVPAQAQGGPAGGSNRNSPKRRLTTLVRGIGELEKAKKAPLTKDQAKKIVAALSPWKAKPKMTEDEAKALYGKINTVLTTKQKNELDKMAAQGRRFGSGDRERGGAGGGGGQGGGQGGPSDAERAQMRQRMQAMQGFMKTYNPFYPPQNYKEMKTAPERFKESFTSRYKSRMEVLTKLAAKAK